MLLLFPMTLFLFWEKLPPTSPQITNNESVVQKYVRYFGKTSTTSPKIYAPLCLDQNEAVLFQQVTVIPVFYANGVAFNFGKA